MKHVVFPLLFISWGHCVSNIVSIETELIAGTPGVVDINGTDYTFEGNRTALTSFTAASGSTYAITSVADNAIVNTNSVSSDQNSFWYRNGSTSNSVQSEIPPSTYSEFVRINDINRGTDNTFVNGTAREDEGNIERLDFIFSEGVSFGLDQAIAIFERGAANGHDSYRVSLIGSLDENGAAQTTVGDRFSQGTWSGDLTGGIGYSIFRSAPSTQTDGIYNVAGGNGQVVGGQALTLEDFGLDAPVTIFGYLIYADDYDFHSVADIQDVDLDITNTTSGIDLASATSFIYTVVPEPNSALLLMSSILFLSCRRKRVGSSL